MYQKLERLGKGSYATVYRSYCPTKKERIAIKKYSKNILESEIKQELDVVLQLDHPNIVSYKGQYRDQKNYHLLFELMDIDLGKYLRKHCEPLNLFEIKYILYQTLLGLEYCHEEKRIVHCDIHPSNLLFNENGEVKISDFGLARSIGKKEDGLFVCTIWYRPLEVLLGTSDCQPTIDIWSLGCTLAQLLTRKPLFPGEYELDQVLKIFHVLGTPTKETCPTLVGLPQWSPCFKVCDRVDLSTMFPSLDAIGLDLLSKMLEMEPTKRISARQTLNHAWFLDFKDTST